MAGRMTSRLGQETGITGLPRTDTVMHVLVWSWSFITATSTNRVFNHVSHPSIVFGLDEDQPACVHVEFCILFLSVNQRHSWHFEESLDPQICRIRFIDNYSGNCFLLIWHGWIVVLRASPLPQGGKGLFNWVFKCCPRWTGYCTPIRGQYSVMWYVAVPNTHLTTKCEIDNDVDCHSGSAEICSLEVARSTKNWRKIGTWFILRRKGCLCCSADWIGYNKSFCCASWYFSMGQTTTRRRCPSFIFFISFFFYKVYAFAITNTKDTQIAWS